MPLSVQQLASFAGGQIKVIGLCQDDSKNGAHSDMRCSAILLQGEIVRLEIVRDSLQARVNWLAKNDGCPTHVSPRWVRCYSKIWKWNIGGVSESSVVRNDVAGLVEIPLVLTGGRIVLFQKRYKGSEFGGLIIPDQVVAG